MSHDEEQECEEEEDEEYCPGSATKFQMPLNEALNSLRNSKNFRRASNEEKVLKNGLRRNKRSDKEKEELLECRDKLSLSTSKADPELSHRAACRIGINDGCLYSPNVKDVMEDDALLQFRRHWTKGEPVIVRKVLEHTSGLSWEPIVMWFALCESTDSKSVTSMSEVKAIDCLAGCQMLFCILCVFLPCPHS